MSARPTVTVVMPVHNGEPFVRHAIASILAQTWQELEFVVVDDGSTDDTPSILASFRDPRIRIVTSASREGIARALNRGLAVASAPLIARQDADDISHPRRLETQLAYVRDHPDVALLGTQVRVTDARGRARRRPGWRRAVTREGIRFQSMFDNPFIHSSVVFRRDAGEYDASLASAEDFDLWSRIAERRPVANLAEKLVDFRIHGTSTAASWSSEHIPRSSAVVERNLRNALGVADVPAEWSHAISSAHIRGDVDAAQLLAILEEIFILYFERHPGDRTNRDVLRIAAAKIAQLAVMLASRNRRDAWAAFGRALRFDAGEARTFATRFLARLAAGGRR